MTQYFVLYVALNVDFQFETEKIKYFFTKTWASLRRRLSIYFRIGVKRKKIISEK